MHPRAGSHSVEERRRQRVEGSAENPLGRGQEGGQIRRDRGVPLGVAHDVATPLPILAVQPIAGEDGADQLRAARPIAQALTTPVDVHLECNHAIW